MQAARDTGHESDTSGETATEYKRSCTTSVRRSLVYRLQTTIHNEPSTMIWEVIAFPSGHEAGLKYKPKKRKTTLSLLSNDTRTTLIGGTNHGHRSEKLTRRKSLLIRERLTPRVLARGRFTVRTNPQGARTLTALPGDARDPDQSDDYPLVASASDPARPRHQPSMDTMVNVDTGSIDSVNIEQDRQSNNADQSDRLRRQASSIHSIDSASTGTMQITSWTTAADIHARVLITAPTYYTSPAWAAVHSLRRNRLLWEREGQWDHAIPLVEHDVVALVTYWVPPAGDNNNDGEAEEEEEAVLDHIPESTNVASALGLLPVSNQAAPSAAGIRSTKHHVATAQTGHHFSKSGNANAQDDLTDDVDSPSEFGTIDLISLEDGSLVKRIFHRWTSIDRHITGSLCVVHRWDDQVYVGDLLTGRRLRRLDLLLPVMKHTLGKTDLAKESDLVRDLALGEFSATHYGYVPLKKGGEPIPGAYRMVDVTGLV
jgi:hypothetical protein